MKKTRILTSEQFNELSEKWMDGKVNFDEYYPKDTAVIVAGENVLYADMQTTCKKAKTVVKRFFDQLNALCTHYKLLEENIACEASEWDGNGFLKRDWMYESGYNWSIESFGDDEWYIFINVDVHKRAEFAPFAEKILYSYKK